MTWTHPSRNRWICVENPEFVVRKTRVRGFYGNRYRLQRGLVFLDSAFSIGEAKALAGRR